ncbi:MAG TPA: DUF6438 domain-containing protein [Gemmatimonadales bacterium]
MFRSALLLSLGVLSCAPRAVPPGQPDAAATTEPESTVIRLERTPCFGRCPVYRVAITASGRVNYVGKNFVTQQGEATGDTPKERLDSLLGEIDRQGFFGFDDRYVAGSPACGPYATDAPSAITEVTHAGRHKRIEHDYGCSQAPAELAELERRIDEVAGTGQWTGRH